MIEIKRESPVRFNVGPPLKIKTYNNWKVALAYENEGLGPWIVDLAHKIRWDVQHSKLDELNISELPMPRSPGKCVNLNGTLINRLNYTQASVYHLSDVTATEPDLDLLWYTNITEATVFLALFGPRIFCIAEKLTSLDLLDPINEAPFLLQGPFCHVPCHIVTLRKTNDGLGGFLLSCSRGYGNSVVNAVLRAGVEFDLHPAGETRFNNWFQKLPKQVKNKTIL